MLYKTMSKNSLIVALMTLLASYGLAQNTTTTRTVETNGTTGRTTTTTTTYQNGQVTKVYRNGVVTEIYQNGVPIDISYYGSLITVKRTTSFDLRNENSLLYKGKFEQYLGIFLSNHRLNQEGRFMPQPNARTPMNQLTRDEFKHYVAEGRPTLTIDGIESCQSCSGTGRRTGLVGTQISEVSCDKCNGRGHFAYTETISLTNTAALPKRPTVNDFVSVGLIEAKSNAAAEAEEMPAKPKKTGMLLDFKKIAPEPEPPKPMAAPVPIPEKKPEAEIELTPLQRFQMTKGKAEAGNSQSQYELALLFMQESEKPVPLDYYEAYNWMLKAAIKNHRMAQFHLGRLYENGLGTDKNIESSLSWRRRAALLGCKQAQKWMGQVYLEVFSGNPRYAELIKKDPTNLIEAYAWFNLGAEIPFPPRTDPKTPSAEELASGDNPLNPRDYNFEKSIPTSAARDRDAIPRNPEFNKKMYEEAKVRCVTIAKEAEQHRAENRPK
jgi:hypothetical protein